MHVHPQGLVYSRTLACNDVHVHVATRRKHNMHMHRLWAGPCSGLGYAWQCIHAQPISRLCLSTCAYVNILDMYCLIVYEKSQQLLISAVDEGGQPILTLPYMLWRLTNYS